MLRDTVTPSLEETDRLASWLEGVDTGSVVRFLAQQCTDTTIFALDHEDRVVYWHPAAGDQSGITHEQAFGLHVEQLGRLMQCPELAEIAANRIDIERNIPGTLPADQNRSHTLISKAFVDKQGRFLGRLNLLRSTSNTLPKSDFDSVSLKKTAPFFGLLSRDPTMLQAFTVIRNVAETDSTVLVRGESGTGKEIVARALHLLSERRQGPFLAINCATLTPTLLESELFGHIRGAFTGAVKDHTGLFKRADRGTVFLDEIAELPLDLQAKLLRVLQERTFIPVGGDRPVKVDVRIVSATHRSLREEVKVGRFRDDLMYRLRVVPIFLPPLRERRGDVSLLLRHFIAKHNKVGPRQVLTVAPEAMRRLLDHDWPGNVRELQNVVEYAFAVGRGPELLLDELPPEFRESAVDSAHKPAATSKSADEISRIRQALADCHGNIEEAAQRLGINRSTLWRKRKKYAI